MTCAQALIVGAEIEHRWRRTIWPKDTADFTADTLHFNRRYLDAHLCASEDMPGLAVNPYFLFNLVLGMSVEDLSENGGPFLGLRELAVLAPTFAGDTISARTSVIGVRESKGHPGWVVATWETTGLNQDGTPVIRYVRSNLMPDRRNEGVNLVEPTR